MLIKEKVETVMWSGEVDGVSMRDILDDAPHKDIVSLLLEISHAFGRDEVNIARERIDRFMELRAIDYFSKKNWEMK